MDGGLQWTPRPTLPFREARPLRDRNGSIPDGVLPGGRRLENGRWYDLIFEWDLDINQC